MIKTFFAVFFAIMCSWVVIDLGYEVAKDQQLTELCNINSGYGYRSPFLCKDRGLDGKLRQ